MNFEVKKTLDINLEQQKLISTPLRSTIIYLLAERPMTAKQVADEMGKTAGSIHYHIQQLYKGGILDIEKIQENRGIIEKYYRSKAINFQLKGVSDIGTHSRGSNLSLTDDELKEFEDELDTLFLKFIQKTVKNEKNRTSYEINCLFKKLNGE
ncbi:ArsR/SmtB family transcription factor [Jeotgalibacillus marinus]|uniref:Winged helix-turn-helix domain-containing protein n=1 Tax=Jeotgalibacillus marinus TaxID=86667 RepID=A0ABV3Q7R4_9BACL